MLGSNDSIFPMGDELATQALKRIRRYRKIGFSDFHPQEIEALKNQVIAILSQTPSGRLLLKDCTSLRDYENETLILTCPDESVARILRDLYLKTIEEHGDYTMLPRVVKFDWPDCKRMLQAPCIFASNYGKTLSSDPDAPETMSIEPAPTLSIASALGFTPENKQEEPFAKLHASRQPATLLSMRTERVVAANLHVIEFCQEPYDDIVGYNVRQLFEVEADHPRYQPTNLTAFHERLKQEKVFEGDIFSWRSTRIFARYPIRAEHHVIVGGNYRLTFFSPIEIIV